MKPNSQREEKREEAGKRKKNTEKETQNLSNKKYTLVKVMDEGIIRLKCQQKCC